MYKTGVSLSRRAAIVIIVDCSTSMKKYTMFNGMRIVKSEAAEFITNMLIDELYERAIRYDVTRYYYDIAIIGFSGDGTYSKLPGIHDFVPIYNFTDFEPQPKTYYFDQTLNDGRCIKVPFVIRPWIKAEAHGTSPLFEAMVRTKDLIERWCADKQNAYSLPPIIFNITDGDCFDDDAWSLIDVANDIMKTSTTRGKSLLINIVLRTIGEEDDNLPLFPTDADFYSTKRSHMILLRMSSILSPDVSEQIKKVFRLNHDGPYRGLAYDTSIIRLLHLVSIGTDPS